MQPACHFDLILDVAGRDVEPILAVGVAGDVVEGDRAEVGRIERIDVDGGSTAVGGELAAVAQRQAGLPAELGAEGDSMQHRSGRGLVYKVGLVEGVLARRLVLVGRQRYQGLGRVYCATRIDVAVTAVVVGIDGAVPYRQAIAEIVVDDGHAGLHFDLGGVVDRAAEKGRNVAIGRERPGRVEPRRARAGQPLRGVAAIGEPEVVVEFVAQLDLGIVGRLQRHRRVDAVALEVAVLPEGVAVLVHRVEAHRDVLVDRLACIHRHALGVPRADRGGGLVDARTVGFLERAIDEAATCAAAEDQRARALEDLDALGVVEVAVVLHVVAETVDEEVGAGVDAADDEFVAVTLALVDSDTRNVARHLSEALEILVADEFLGHHVDGLRDIDQRRVGLGRARGAVGVNADGTGLGILRGAKCFRSGRLDLRPARGLRAPLRRTVRALRIRGAGDTAFLLLRRRDLDWRKLRGARRLRVDFSGGCDQAERKTTRGEQCRLHETIGGTLIHVFSCHRTPQSFL